MGFLDNSSTTVDAILTIKWRQLLSEGKGLGLVKYALRPIKVLGNGELNKKVNVTASAVSSSATKKIEKKGGTVTVQ